MERHNDRANGLLLATVPGVGGEGEVFIIATNTRRASGNRKTGDCIQIWSIPTAGLIGYQSHACGSCPLLPASEGGAGGCYVTKLFISQIEKNAAAGRYPAWDGDTRDFAHLFVRFGAWGDPCLLPLPLVERIATACRGWTGYTHEWRRPENQGHSRYFMASVHDAGEAREATIAGWRWFAAPFLSSSTDWPGNAIQCLHQAADAFSVVIADCAMGHHGGGFRMCGTCPTAANRA